MTSPLAYLVLVFCLNGECQKIYQPEPIQATICMTTAQQQAAQWLDEHPRYQFDSYRCVIGHKPGPYEENDW